MEQDGPKKELYKNTKTLTLPCGSIVLLDTEDFKKYRDIPWFKSEQGYVRGRLMNADEVRGRAVMLHRLILNTPEGVYVDHINGDKLDNTKANLRMCSKQQNSWNRKPTKGSSAHKGVWFVKSRRKWRSSIRVNGKAIHLGYYKTEEDAAKAYNEAAIKYFGEFAWLNNV